MIHITPPAGQHMRRGNPLWLPVLSLLVLLLAACSQATPTPLPPTPAPLGGSCSLEASFADDQSAVTRVLNAEGELVVAQDIDRLMRLWVEESQVVDAHNTPDNPDDDQSWSGKDAIRNRYTRIVFPGAPTAVQHSAQEVEIEGERAVIQATTEIGGEVSPAGDRWELVKQDSCWYLASLTYNLESAP